jgi:hypothetical protein
MTAQMANANVRLKADSNLKMDHHSVDLDSTLSTALIIHTVNFLLVKLKPKSKKNGETSAPIIHSWITMLVSGPQIWIHLLKSSKKEVRLSLVSSGNLMMTKNTIVS